MHFPDGGLTILLMAGGGGIGAGVQPDNMKNPES
jgi:hypothetical protein